LTTNDLHFYEIFFEKNPFMKVRHERLHEIYLLACLTYSWLSHKRYCCFNRTDSILFSFFRKLKSGKTISDNLRYATYQEILKNEKLVRDMETEIPQYVKYMRNFVENLPKLTKRRKCRLFSYNNHTSVRFYYPHDVNLNRYFAKHKNILFKRYYFHFILIHFIDSVYEKNVEVLLSPETKKFILTTIRKFKFQIEENNLEFIRNTDELLMNVKIDNDVLSVNTNNTFVRTLLENNLWIKLNN